MFAAVVGQSWATAAHPFNIEINGVDRIAAIQYSTIRIEMPGPGSNGSMSFELWDPDASITIAEWDEVRFIEHAATRPILFGGFVQSVRYSAWASAGRAITVECVGYGILLDRKVHVEASLPFNVDVDEVIQRIVSLYGGIITAQSAAALGSPDATYGIPAYATESTGRWLLDYFMGSSDPVVPAPCTLRAAVEYVLSIALSEADFLATLSAVSVPGVFWVDSARMFRLLADGSGSSHTKWQSGGVDYPGQYDGGVPGPAFDAAGTYPVVEASYEREDTDRLTSIYVEGGAGAGTGFVRAAQGLDRAGDLEAIVSDANSLTADDLLTKGRGQVRQTQSATARGSITIESATPLDIWPGRQMSYDRPELGLTSALKWRMTTVNITFLGSESRQYRISFGGNLPVPSMARRQGRYRVKGQ